MKKLFTLWLVLTGMLLFNNATFSQDTPIHPNYLGYGTFHGETPPLRDLPPITYEEYQDMVAKAHKKFLNPKLQHRSYPFADQALPRGFDEVWQRTMGTTEVPKSPIVNFAGQTSPYFPSDCNGTAGPNHYMQTINCVYAIYSKTGALMAGPTNMNTLFAGVTGSTYNDGDPLVLYDEQAQRWLAVEFSISGSNDYMLVAVSTTNDPTGTWYKYSFDVADLPDYEKFGIWQDGYYMGDNNSSSNDIYVFQRSVMLTGGANPAMIGFNNPWRPSTIDGFMCVPPLDNDGPAAPAGSPGIFITINDDAIGGGSDQLWIYELTANWTTPSSSTFTRVQQLNVSAFDSNFGNTWDNIVQPGTSQKLDAIPMVIMNPPQYRNFGSYQTIVCCHTVDVDATNHAGIRWYELRRGTQTSGGWSVRQQGTYAPDSHSRWMGSIMLNGSGQIGLGYSISSSTIYPGIRYTGQSSSAYNSANGIMDIPEEIIQTATTSQSSYNRWGDYAQMSVDPSDDKTFWFTTQYGGSRQTKIASFKFGNAPTVTTLPASTITTNSAYLNGTINPNGLATTWYFQWGTTTSYGNTTTITSAGSGTVAVNASAKLSNLTPGVMIHYRLVGQNTDGTTYGNDLTFTPGAASVTTAAVTLITTSSAVSGGNVVSDGGTEVTARGVCWSTTTNPTISNNHTSDGTGTGIFISTIPGLSANTTYHVRAYATNANGTFYGEDLTFTTLCGVISTFPWNEGFENSGTIPSCWTQEQVNSSGLDWVFITGNGATNPPNAHTGTYNACLKDNTTSDNITRLITPPINLSLISNPTLTFWHTQAQGTTSTRQDQLYVYYRTSATGTWTLLASYTSSITTWTQRTITLPNSSSEYYINFQGNAKRGRGVCIDDVSITGTNPTLSVTPSNRDVNYTAGSTTFSVISNSSWTTSSNQGWCTTTPSGTGNGTIQVNYLTNTSNLQRIASITVTVTGLTPVIVTLTQAGIPCTDPTAFAGNDNTTCGTLPYLISDAAATNYSSVLWSTSGNGSFSNTAIINPEYFPETGATASTVILTLTAQPISPCINAATDNMLLFIQPVPTVNAGEDISILDYVNVQLSGNATSYQTTNWTTSGDGYFDQPANPATIYHPGTGDIENSFISLTLNASPVSPCTTNVTDDLVLTILQQHEIEFQAGWSGFSSFVVPLDADFSNLMNPVFDNLVVAKTVSKVYWPEFGVNTIGNFDVHQGYMVKMTEPATLQVLGVKSPDKTLQLALGWNMISVISQEEVPYQELTTQLGDKLIIITEVGGNQIFWPAAGIFSLNALFPGKSYLVKVSENCSFTFPD